MNVPKNGMCSVCPSSGFLTVSRMASARMRQCIRQSLYKSKIPHPVHQLLLAKLANLTVSKTSQYTE